MKKGQIKIHRRLPTHQSNVAAKSLAVPVPTTFLESPELIAGHMAEGSSSVADVEMELLDFAPEPTNVQIPDQIQNADELQEALSQIAGMLREDFFDEPAETHECNNENPQGYDWMNWLFEEMDDHNIDPEPNENNVEEDPRGAHTQDANLWFPFKNKMELLGCLMIGYSRHITSRATYEQNRMLLGSLCQMALPAWSTIRRAQQRILDLLDVHLDMSTSVWGTPCASLGVKNIIQKELANPRVGPEISFYPEETNGHNISCLAQSEKWLKDLPVEMRPQMCTNNGQHFYIFEPLETFKKELFVPIFYYTFRSRLHAKCIIPQIQQITHTSVKIFIPSNISYSSLDLVIVPVDQFMNEYSKIKLSNGQFLAPLCKNVLYEVISTDQPCRPVNLPNPWRIKADGKIIRHIPTTMYSDDTSGNVSKQFNKHISFYFTLSGLPPHLSNQEYNCHFLSTSNRAGVLEIASQIVKESNDMTLNGFEAYDVTTGQPVLVMSMMLCFLADSPMHAEITNTPVPGASLNPCRICTLNAPKKADKKSLSYLLRFLELGPDGEPDPNPSRSWWTTIEHTYDLYNLFIKKHITAVNNQRKIYGVTDSLNNRFIEGKRAKSPAALKKLILALEIFDITELFNPFLKLLGFDGCKDTPVEILHVFLLGVVKYLVRDFITKMKKPKNKKKLLELLGRLESFNTNSLNIPLLKAWYLINHSQSLVGKDFKIFLQAIPFILFPFMNDEERGLWLSLSRLASYVFQTHITHMPTYQIELRLHILIFMSHMIKFTAQWINKPKFHILLHLPDSILRFGPAVLFATEKFESFNGVVRNSSTHSNKQAPGKDIAISFSNELCIRFLMSGGVMYNKASKSTSQCSNEMLALFSDNPIFQRSLGYNAELTMPSTHYPFQKRTTLKTEEEVPIPPCLAAEFPSGSVKQIAKLQLNRHEVVEKGFFILVEEANGSEYIGSVCSVWIAGGAFFAHVIKMKQLEIHPFYGMRRFDKTNETLAVHTKHIKSTLNLQHNCYTAGCQVTNTKSNRMERLETTIKTPEVQHKNGSSFILNSALLHAPEDHRRLADLPIARVTPEQWLEICALGLARWGVVNAPAAAACPSAPDTPIETPPQTPGTNTPAVWD
ncbi:hypothetical protein Pst134EB_029552 [Puccinia striiformis f. sp. tritici]|nr:hypothetical protein Pst134EB_029552 [Puccinia striiformis f. sp. tritici]